MMDEATDRSCGGCTACCKTHAVFEINKSQGEWCPDCAVGQGCRIYFMRPVSCKAFKCAWFMGVGVTELRHRPDKTNIVPDYKVISGVGMALWLWEVEAGELDSRFVIEWTRRNLQVGNHVLHIPLHRSVKLYLPEASDFSGQLVIGVDRRKVEIVRFEWQD